MGEPGDDGEFDDRPLDPNDYEPSDADGEAFRGDEAAAYQQEQMDEARSLKR